MSQYIQLIQELVELGELVYWQPRVESVGCLRHLFITRDLNEELDPNVWKDPSFGHRYGLLAADFDRYVGGDTIQIGMNPYEKGKSAFMARVDPTDYGIWDMRSVDPKPSLRIFGAFVDEDIFIAVRSYERTDLDGKGGPAWANARENTVSQLQMLLPGIPLLTGKRADDFITENTISV